MVECKQTSTYDVPADVNLTQKDGPVNVKVIIGETDITFSDNYVKLEDSRKSVKILISKDNRRNRGISGAWGSEVKNLVAGVTSGFEYEMKIDYTHFPMRVSVKGNSVLIENFLGERSPRTAVIVGGTKVSVKGDRVMLNGIDKRDVGHTAANIERATKIKGFDLRVFQDGIYLMKGRQ